MLLHAVAFSDPSRGCSQVSYTTTDWVKVAVRNEVIKTAAGTSTVSLRSVSLCAMRL